MNSTTDPGLEFVRQLGAELANKDFDIPSFPDTALRVRQALHNPNVSLDTLSSIVLSEPALTARLLRMANSALMRRGTLEITDVKTAISRLGFHMVENAAVSIAANEVFQAPANSPLRRELDKVRKHSVRVSAIAYVLARYARISAKPDDAMLAGLLHAIGKFYILTRANKFPNLFTDSEALESLLNNWHTGVGRAIVEAWGFPEEIVEAVDEHELLDRQKFGPADLTDVIIAANLLAKAGDDGIGDLSELNKLPSMSRLRLDGAAAHELVEASKEEIQSMTQALSS